MNRFFMAFASIFTSGIFAFSYLKEWILVQYGDQRPILTPSPDIVYPYFHQSHDLYMKVILIFGLMFFVLFASSVFFTVQKKEKKVFLCFVLTMFTILAVMVNGA